MSKYTVYVDFADIEKIQIYQAKGKYTAASLRNLLGCDYIINGGLYTMATMKPNCKLKVDGTVVVSDQWNYVGPAWNNPPVNAAGFNFMILPPNTSGLAGISQKNAIACVCMKYNGKTDQGAINGAQNNSAMGYSTSRTAIGKCNGKLAMFICNDSMRPKAMYDYLNGQGWTDILMLDGGGSTQGYLGSGKQITSSRKVYNYICVYLKNGSSGSSSGSSLIKDNCDFSKPNPYTKPTRAIQYGMTGNDVKWIQFQLNCHDIVCDVDGSFGPSMLTAVKNFQKSHGLSVDGSCGPDTRTALSKDHSQCSSTYTTKNNPYPKPTRVIRYYTTGNDVKWVQYQLNVAGYSADIDGSYGPDAVSKVKEFQSDHGLEVDGSCGPATRTALANL